MTFVRFTATLPLLALLVGACANGLPPSSVAPVVSSVPPTSPTPLGVSPEPTATRSAAADATCDADITVSGGYEGHVTGSVNAAPRRIGDGDSGASIDAFLDLPQQGVPTRFLFSVFDADGPDGPKVLNALFGEVQPGVTSRGWQEGKDQVSASLAEDGSRATFDLEFGRIGVGPQAHVVGWIDCPPLP